VTGEADLPYQCGRVFFEESSMPFASRTVLIVLVLSAAVLAGCSMSPFKVSSPETAVAAAEAVSQDEIPRLRPRAISVCYSATFNDPAEVDDEASYLCDGGRLEKLDENTFWNGCSLSQPHRVNYICYPPDNAKRLPEATDDQPSS
jgi:hypothetical protein